VTAAGRRASRLGVRIISLLLLVDAVDTVVYLDRVLPSAASLPTLALWLIALRLVAGALEARAGWLLWRDRPAGRPLALVALIGAATLTTLIVGLGLGPSAMAPRSRLPVVACYWVVALVYELVSS
jgi:hypothetical protein